ncbi:MAG TPA: ABC transporter ATP-binding protein [Desulfobacteria bacterium]|nr:ABC transporter ATP-binding protein [Desulfobacteria bacterium]
MTLDAAIVTKGLTKIYADNLAVNGLDLEVPRGTVYGFLGLNGAGKTTTIKMLLNLVYPTSGKGMVLGHDIVDETRLIKDKVGYVPEEPVLYEYMHISELLAFCKDTYSKWDMKTVGKYLDLFELSVGKKVKQLSKGMKNQLALALALGANAELLILDEPTGGLDPAKTRDFFRVILEQVAETGQTVFFSSHRLYEVERVADRVCIIHKGKQVFDKSIDDIKTSFKQIRVVFENEESVNKAGKIDGVASVIQQGRGCILESSKKPEAIIAALKEMKPLDIEVIDMNLEGIFLKYTGGENYER